MTISTRIGSSRLEVLAGGLGCVGMSELYGPGDDTESIAAVHHALDLGITFLDPADMSASEPMSAWSARPSPTAVHPVTAPQTECSLRSRDIEDDAEQGQLALARRLARGDDVVLIPGAEPPVLPGQDAPAADIELAADGLARIDELAPAGASAGHCVPDLAGVGGVSAARS